MKKDVLNHLFATYYKEKFNLTEDQVQALTNGEKPATKPNNREICHTMEALGITREEMGRYLGITRQGVHNSIIRYTKSTSD